MSETQGTERRRHQRKSLSKPVTVTFDSDAGRISNYASTVDLSEGGARVRTHITLTAGDTVRIIPQEGAGRAVPGRVVWVGPARSDRLVEAGLEFLQGARVVLST